MPRKHLIFITRKGNHLVPVSQMDADDILELPEGKTFAVEFTRRKSARMEKFYHALCKDVWEATGSNDTLVAFKRQLKAKVGLVDFYMHEGKRQPLDISLADLDFEEFKAYVTLAIDVMIYEYLPHAPRTELLGRIESRLNYTFPQAERGWEDDE